MKANFFLLIFLISLRFYSQNKSSFELENMDIPTAPATTLLDQNITSIENPKTIKEFGVSVLNSFKDNGLPQNFAVEFNPYWIFKKSKDIKGYFDAERHSAITHNSSVSFAFIKNDSIQNASVGIRGNIFRVMGKKYNNIIEHELPSKIDNFGKSRNEIFIQLSKQSEKEKGEISKSCNVDIKNITYSVFSEKYLNTKMLIQGSILEKKELEPILSKIDSLAKDEANFNFNKANISKAYDELKKAIGYITYDINKVETTTLDEFQKYIDDLSETQPIFSIDFASAYNHFFDKNTFSSGKFGRFGAWITMNYSITLNEKSDKEKKKNYLKLFLLNRYIVDHMQYNKALNTYEKNTFYDVGAKVGLEFNKLSFAYEYVKRLGDNEDYRSIGSIMYKINKNVSLVGGFGKNFEEKNNLITTLGLRWGLNFNNEFETK